MTDLVAGAVPAPFTLPRGVAGGPVVQPLTPDAAGEVPGAQLSFFAGASTVAEMASPSNGDTVSKAFLSITVIDLRAIPQLLWWHGEGAEPMVGEPKPAAPTLDPPFEGLVLPGSGGSNAQSAGSSGPAAWLASHVIHVRVAGSSRALGYSEHAPSPVSFDPGSSPG
ncbi:hypothetical protein [Pseudarthrobacter sp. NPDC080039]|uniref:hypothetical protein n=1 Tax=unclassified Pseudarthrobacter TaxID=2647000 RepID=UPI00344D8276